MLKLEIKLDDSKIRADQKYKAESIYQSLEQTFAKYKLRMVQEPDGTLFFCGNGNPKDYGAFGCIITSLKEKAWFFMILWYLDVERHLIP